MPTVFLLGIDRAAKLRREPKGQDLWQEGLNWIPACAGMTGEEKLIGQDLWHEGLSWIPACPGMTGEEKLIGQDLWHEGVSWIPACAGMTGEEKLKGQDPIKCLSSFLLGLDRAAKLRGEPIGQDLWQVGLSWIPACAGMTGKTKRGQSQVYYYTAYKQSNRAVIYVFCVNYLVRLKKW